LLHGLQQRCGQRKRALDSSKEKLGERERERERLAQPDEM
jgi:hypothetical protein